MDVKKGVFYAVGLGPGDPELVTRKAARVLERCPVIAAPRTRGDGMLALSIARQAAELEGKTILPIDFPMERDPARRRASYGQALREIGEHLSAGRDVAMVSLGDVSIYATGGYLTKLLRDQGWETVMIPGVPSFCAAAARLGVSLTTQSSPLHILPAGDGAWEEALDLPGTKVLMKAGRRLPQVLAALERRGLLDRAALAENCGLPGERVCAGLSREAGFGYFTTVIVGERGRDGEDRDPAPSGGYRKILLFGGATEGRLLARELSALGAEVTVSVATPLGAEELAGIDGLTLWVGRKTAGELVPLLSPFDLCVDATHPYAAEATANIKAACAAAGVPLRRLLRRPSVAAGAVQTENCAQAAAYLAGTQGNILLATGAKELSAFAGLEPGRVYARVLPTREGIAACEALGLAHSHILALQGPFSQKLNEAMMEQYRIRWLVTKDGGTAGGFEEKLAAARRVGAELVLVGRPPEEGEDLETILADIKGRLT